MRIIALKRIREYMAAHARARVSLEEWVAKTQSANWKNLGELRATFPKADVVKVASGREVVVFNIGGNAFRMIGAVHFRTGIVFVLRFMTHAEYSKDARKDTL